MTAIETTMLRSPRSLMRAAVALLLGTVFAGCSLAPIYERPAAPLPHAWSSGEHSPGRPHDVAEQQASSSATLHWQRFIVDDSLRGLVETALANNRDLRQALLNVEAARAMYRVQRAERVPSLEAQGAGSRQRLSQDLLQPGYPPVQQSVQVGLVAPAFEIDLFGRVQNLSEAALREYLATEEAAQGARITLVAEVIQAWLARDGAQRRQLLTRRTLESRESSLRLIERRRQAGTATALDFYEASGLAEQARADLERIDRELRQSTNALALLAGVPDIGARLPASPQEQTLLVQTLAPGAPSELLTWRPDIRAAEHRLRARNADIGAARAAFFPRITLTGMFGTASGELSELFGAGQRVWSFAPQLTLPIFSGGRNLANLDLAEVRKEIAVAEYERTIQTAFREVSDALAATDTLRREEASRRTLADTTGQALRLSEARYRAGVDDHLRYLDAQRSHFAAQTAWIEVSTQRQAALATLFRTLGGGWEATP